MSSYPFQLCLHESPFTIPVEISNHMQKQRLALVRGIIVETHPASRGRTLRGGLRLAKLSPARFDLEAPAGQAV